MKRHIFWVVLVLATLAFAACSGGSSNLNRSFAGRTLQVNVVEIDRAPELRYATIDPLNVIRHWRVLPSSEDKELILVRLKVSNHTAISAIVNVDQQAAELRGPIRGSYFPIDLAGRLYQDMRQQANATIHMNLGQCFDPNRLYISQGTTVNWVNDGENVHFVNLDPENEDVARIEPGGSFTHTFADVGVVDYQCFEEKSVLLQETENAEQTEDMENSEPESATTIVQDAQIVVESSDNKDLAKERSMVFITGPFELLRGMGIDGWMVFEAPEGTEFRDLRWQSGDSIIIPF